MSDIYNLEGNNIYLIYRNKPTNKKFKYNRPIKMIQRYHHAC
jgi:hypothetical protein